jgi:Zn-finger nucleic acid-binding protein
LSLLSLVSLLSFSRVFLPRGLLAAYAILAKPMAAPDPQKASICPKCLVPSVSVPSLHGGAARCSTCGGLWLPGAAFQQQLTLRGGGPPPMMRPLPAVLATSGLLTCPDCSTTSLRVFRAGGLEFERCEKCAGLFFDPGEWEVFRCQIGPISGVAPARRHGGLSSGGGGDGVGAAIEIFFSLGDLLSLWP